MRWGKRKVFLCFKCNKLKDEGKALKCPDCGNWYYADKGCTCKLSVSQGENKIVKAPPAVKADNTVLKLTLMNLVKRKSSTTLKTKTLIACPI